MESLRQELTGSLKALHLPTIRRCFEEEALKAQSESLSYETYLLGLVQKECEARNHHRIEKYLQESKLPLGKTLEAFDLKKMPQKVIQQMRILLKGDFLAQRENVLVFGNPGSGKTHLLSALGAELVRQGKRVYFSSCALLVQDLLRAKAELKLARYLKGLEKYQALVIDDLGYVQQSQEEMEVLFTLFAERYERGSVLITSNLPFSQWEKIFKNPMVTAAAIDRLVHHSVILELNLPSYRMEQAKQQKGGKSAPEV